jgi:hypothetical protein
MDDDVQQLLDLRLKMMGFALAHKGYFINRPHARRQAAEKFIC